MAGSVSGMIAAARGGEGEALDRLLKLYRNYLRFLAGREMGQELRTKADSSDVAQETLLLAYERFEQFRGRSEGELIAWLRQILARNVAGLARRYLGTAARDVGRERSIQASLDQSSFALGRLLAHEGTSPSANARAHERSVALADALARLSRDQRRAIIYRNLEQLSWDETAKLMHRTPAAARMVWTRALQKLGPLIAGQDL